ncbi:hypothetical protein CPB86DRAFT_792249, partial [Serendipita vermifera]
MTIPVLTPHHDPHLVHHAFLNNVPNADLNRSNILTNSDTLSPLSYVLATSPEPSHGWVVFKLVQWEALRASSPEDTSFIVDPFPFTFPPSAFTTDSSKSILEFWNALDPGEIFEWEELARDIRIAYAQLASRFGNGIEFDGSAWEYWRQYHARNIFLKWMGYQAIQALPAVTDTTLTQWASINFPRMRS